MIFTARRKGSLASAVHATANPSVSPSVRHTPVLCQNEGTQKDTVKLSVSRFLMPIMVDGDDLLSR